MEMLQLYDCSVGIAEKLLANNTKYERHELILAAEITRIMNQFLKHLS